MSAAGYLLTSTPLRLASVGSSVAIPILAVQRLDDVALGGMLVAASLAPSIVAAPLVGVVLDRTRHPRALILLSGVVTAVAFALAALLGSIPTPVLAIALLAAGAVAPFFMGGLSSFVAEEIAGERRAYAIDSLSYNIGSVGGPAIVALASIVADARLAMLALAGSAALGAVGALATSLRPLAAGDGSWRSTLRDGARHLVRHRPIALVTASGALSQFGAGGLAIAAVALSIERVGSPDEGAVVVSSFAVGGLLGALLVTVRPGRMRPELSMGLGFAAIGLFTVAASVDLGFGTAVVLLGLSGLFTGPSAASMLLLRKQQSPPAVRSQVFTVGAGLRATASAAGAAVAGVAAGAGATVLLVAIGVTWLASAALLLAYPTGAPPLDGSDGDP